MRAISMDVSQPTRLMAMFVGTMLVLTAGGTEATLGAQPADAPSTACGGSQPTAVAAAFELLTTAQRHSTSWDGPTTGPKALPDKLVVYVAQDMRNGGVLGVSEGVQAAAAAIGWRLKTIDGVGSVAGRVQAINQAVALRPDGISWVQLMRRRRLRQSERLRSRGSKSWAGIQPRRRGRSKILQYSPTSQPRQSTSRRSPLRMLSRPRTVRPAP